MNDRKHGEFIDQEMDRLITEADGDGWLALRMSIAERLSLGDLVSSGLCRLRPLSGSGFHSKERVVPLDVPSGPEGENPNS